MDFLGLGPEIAQFKQVMDGLMAELKTERLALQDHLTSERLALQQFLAEFIQIKVGK